MQDDLKKKKLFLIGAAIVMLVAFGYLGYLVMGGVTSAKEKYIEKYKEIITLEQKQNQSTILQAELSRTAAEREKITSILLGQSDEEKLRLVIQFEDIAKSIGLVYDWEILRTITEGEFPGIVFSISLQGGYSGIIRFIERLQALPYYTHIERLGIVSKAPVTEGSPSVVAATMEVTVFSK